MKYAHFFAALVLVAAASLLPPQTLRAQTATAVPGAPAPASAGLTTPPTLPTQGFSELAEKLLPAVVNVSTTQTIKEKPGLRDLPELPQFPPGSPFEEFFRDFMERHNNPGLGKKGERDEDLGDGDLGGTLPRQRKTTSLGSGFIISSEGLIVTNNHVIQDADEITVILHDDTNLKAQIIGRDSKTDIALLKVKAEKPLPYVTFGDSDKVKVGDWTVVIGNPFGLGGTVTAGIISARARDINSGPYDDYLQTDASINRGNSGGPMFNLKGEVIGICTAIFSPSGGSVGIGFAIPSNLASNVVAQLKNGGKIHRGWLGVRIQNVTEEIAKSLNLEKAQGALVSSLTKDGPASKAGIEPGDVIIAFDGKPVADMRRLPRMVAEAGVNRQVPLTIWRNNRAIQLSVKLGEMQEEEKQTGDDNEEEGAAAPLPKGVRVAPLGIHAASITPEMRKAYGLDDAAKGLVITALSDASVLQEKGVRVGDVIVEVAQKPAKDPETLLGQVNAALAAKKPLLLLLSHQGEVRFVAVNLETAAPKAGKDKLEE